MCFVLVIPLIYLVVCAISTDLRVEVLPLLGTFVIGGVIDILSYLGD